MKIKNLFYLLLALPLAFAACDSTNDVEQTPDPVLTLTSENSFKFDAEGGEGTITYTLENAVEGTELRATTTAAWITDITVGENITFAVTPNETTETRSDRIMVEYGAASFNVFINQEGVEPFETFEAEMLILNGFGIITDGSAYNMNIYLSDIGLSSGGYYQANATYYRLDLYWDDEPLLDEEGYRHITPGTYTFDGSDNATDMSIGYTLSGYMKVNASGAGFERQSQFEAAELVVTEDGLTLTAYVDGVKHIVTYSGDTMFFEGKKVEFEGEELLTPHLGMATYLGTDYSDNYNYYFYLSDKGFDENGMLLPDGYYFKIDLFGIEPVIDEEGYLHIPAGTYTLDDNGDKGAWEIGYQWSFCMKMNEQGSGYEFRENYESAVLEVTENGMYGEIVINSGLFAITFEGEPKFYVGL
jgi:hypothetical protein